MVKTGKHRLYAFAYSSRRRTLRFRVGRTAVR